MAKRQIVIGVASILITATQALAQADRTSLPIARPAFSGVITEASGTSVKAPHFTVSAPRGAPNVIVFMSDDQGFFHPCCIFEGSSQ